MCLAVPAVRPPGLPPPVGHGVPAETCDSSEPSIDSARAAQRSAPKRTCARTEQRIASLPPDGPSFSPARPAGMVLIQRRGPQLLSSPPVAGPVTMRPPAGLAAPPA
eukprot:366131-Chlamydomonas_euryale.AAC.19